MPIRTEKTKEGTQAGPPKLDFRRLAQKLSSGGLAPFEYAWTGDPDRQHANNAGANCANGITT
jgi:hypothetical protein